MNNFVYGDRSLSNLATCHPFLQTIAYEGLKRSPVDISIIHGWRGEEQQNQIFHDGFSTKPWPESKHNHVIIEEEMGFHTDIPHSLAFDFAPWVNSGIDWKDINMFCVVAGVFFAVAAEHNISIRWGMDWDMDGSTRDQTLMDAGHIELML